ncbi:MAG TPA: S8 family serine peptidase [Conexibacter sp.]|jgi:subtilisin family serine protease
MRVRSAILRSLTAAAIPLAAVMAVGAAAQPAGAAEPGSQERVLTPDPLQLAAPLQPAPPLAHTPGAAPSATARSAYLLQLAPAATMRAFQSARPDGVAAARSAARAQLGRVVDAQARAISALPAHTSVLYRTHSVLAGVAVMSTPAQAGALGQLPGVRAVYPIVPKSVDNSYAIPFQGGTTAWGPTPGGDLGANVRIAVIDTGIDYTHADFGGPGTTTAYDAAHATDSDPADPSLFPNGKVVGGYDFVGDAYDADRGTPAHEDANPLDCAGHGSHVAGSAAGYGENIDGSTYSGAYDASTPFSTLKIGPGMAPRAQLLAYRVFGCEGTTDFVAAALDMATDPDGNGVPTDRADVINLSLGSTYGSPDDGDARAVNAAVDEGVTVAVAAGNDGDFIDVGGSPGTARRAITVANSEDAASVVDGAFVSIDGAPAAPLPVTRAVLYDWSGPDLDGDVVPAPAGDATACAAFPPGTDFHGDVVFVEWNDDALECGSAARATNLEAAHAGGFIFGNTNETFNAGISGSATIPGVLLAKSGADAIRDALQAHQPVTVNGTAPNAASQMVLDDNDKVSPSSSRGIHAAGDMKPDVAAVGTSVFSAAVRTGTEGVSETGTSMATPMVAGLAALVLAAHHDWTPQQVKADIMNTAGNDLYVGGSADPASDMYAPARVGAGRIDAADAVDNTVLAYDSDPSDAGAVSVSFGPVEVTGAMTLTRHVAVKNTSTTTAAAYDASYDAITTVPGVSYTVSPSTFTIQPGATQTVTVTFSVTSPALLTKTVDPTVGRLSAQRFTDGGFAPRSTLSEASGRLLLAPQVSGSELRLPVYAAPRPASRLTQPASLELSGSGPQQSAALTFSGTDVGSGDANGGDTPDDPDDDIFSIAAGFELQATSGPAPLCGGSVDNDCVDDDFERAADIAQVGYTSNSPQTHADPSVRPMAYFAVTTQRPWTTPASDSQVFVLIDTDGDGEPDFFLHNTRAGLDDVFVSELEDAHTGDVYDEPLDDLWGNVDTAVYDSDAMILPVSLDVLAEHGVTPDSPRVNYGVESFSLYGSAVWADEVGGVDPVTSHLSRPLTADLYAPGVTVTAADTGSGPLLVDQNGAQRTVTRDVASYAADSGQGLLMLHLHNPVGDKGQVVALTDAAPPTGDHDEPPTDGSQDPNTPTGPTLTGPTVTPPQQSHPTITARLSSAHKETRFGWYRSAVTVRFTCTADSSPLVGACPKKVTVTRNGAKLRAITRTVTAADGGTGSVTVRGLKIDRVKPSVKITRARNGVTHRGTLPKTRCVARDALSGVVSCKLVKRVKGMTITYTATASDRAGNVRVARMTARTRRRG